MKNKFLSKILNRDVFEGEVLSAADTAIVENYLAQQESGGEDHHETDDSGDDSDAETQDEETEEEEESSEDDDSTDETALTNKTLQKAIAQGMAPVMKEIQSLKSRINVIEGKPGSTKTKTPAVSGSKPKVDPWNDPNSKTNKFIDNHFK